MYIYIIIYIYAPNPFSCLSDWRRRIDKRNPWTFAAVETCAECTNELSGPKAMHISPSSRLSFNIILIRLGRGQPKMILYALDILIVPRWRRMGWPAFGRPWSINSFWWPRRLSSLPYLNSSFWFHSLICIVIQKFCFLWP